MNFAGGQTQSHCLSVSSDGPELSGLQEVLPRMAAHRRLTDLSEEQAAELAEQYQLVTEHTSCVLTYESEEDDKAEQAPALRKVPQTMAAGWGGMGSVLHRKRVAPFLSTGVPDDTEFCLAAVDYCDEGVQYSRKPYHRGFRSWPEPLDFIEELNARYPEDQSAKLELDLL